MKKFFLLTIASMVTVFAMAIGDDNTTAIHSTRINPTTDNDHIYNLQGLRVDHPTKGIYIRNGRKVVIR